MMCMRILFINKASLRHEGGAEIRTREVGKRLVLSGHEVVVFAAKTDMKNPSFEVLDGMKLYYKRVLPDFLLRRFSAPHYLSLAAANLFLMFHLYFFLKREKFDWIREDFSPFPPSFLLALVKLPVSKRMAVVHNLSRKCKEWIQRYGLLYGIFGFLMYRMLTSGKLKYDRIICAAQWLTDDLKRFPKISGSVSYVPNGIDLDHFSKRRDSLPRASSPDVIRLLSVGRLVELKGYRYVIEAISYLKEEYPQIQLVIFGKGPLKDPLRGIAERLGVGEQIEIHSPVPYEEMPKVYQQSDFLVLPFTAEGFPMTILEGMAMGIPIVATDIPGITGILSAVLATLALRENSRDLADKLKWAFEHPDELSQKTALARQCVKRYNWDLIAKQEIE